jgi:NADPH-dependent 2,4-dienoyl-CoA reductase/sulfur reductase-like enzyme
MRTVDLVIIGGGSAGLAAALAAREEGVRNILILERSAYLGGVLRQCIHNGFGLHTFGEDLTGVEYARRYVLEIQKQNIPYLLETFVLTLTPDLKISAMNGRDGLFDIQARTIILAMGCRERPRGNLLIPGWRSAGVLTAGAAQRYLNIEGYLPGRRVVILGSGDIGLIMARQFVVEGCRVERVVEILPYSSGLVRNISQCLHDFDIPINYSSSIIEIEGRSRVEAVLIAKVDEKKSPIPGTEERIPCDTVLISAGLIPENELSQEAGVALSVVTWGPVVDDTLQSSVPGIFACGNVLHVHDLVDHVSREADRAGRNAALYLKNHGRGGNHGECLTIQDGHGVAGVVPQYLRRTGGEKKCTLMFRSRGIYRNCTMCITVSDQVLVRTKRRIVSPGEMQELELDRGRLPQDARTLTIYIEEEKQ